MDAGVIASNIRECHLVLEGLMQIIQNNSDSASQSRLMQLYSTKFDAQWRCVCDSSTFSYCSLYLYYNSSKVDTVVAWERHARLCRRTAAGKGERKMFSVQYISNVSLQDWDCFVIELCLHALHVVPSSSS